MKKSLMEILVCPVCHGKLELDSRQSDGDEITAGTLRCVSCKHDYPIADGIPNLLPPKYRDMSQKD